jgi:hypothetical protein
VSVTASPASSPQIGLISVGALEELRLPGQVPTYDVAQVIDRRLHELDAADTPETAGDHLVIIRRDLLISALVRGIPAGATDGGESAPPGTLRIEAQELFLGDPRLFDEESPATAALVCVYLEWSEATKGESRVVRLFGEPLVDVQASAQIVAGPAGSQLVLAAPIASLVETSIALPDVLTRLIAHPAVTTEIPAGDPDSASVRVLPERTDQPIHLQGGVSLRIGAAAGFVDPVQLDLELRSAMAAATEIAAAVAEGHGSVARLSRIPRAWSSLSVGSSGTA